MKVLVIVFRCFLLCVVLTISCLLVITKFTNLKDNVVTYAHKLVPSAERKANNSIRIFRKRKLDPRNRTYILAWTHPWNVITEGFSEGKGNDQCVVTYDRSRLRDASAVLFHYTSLDKESIPWQHYRDSDQVFVLGLREAPSVVELTHRKPHGMNKFNNFINWTMGYGTYNDIWRPYSRQGDLRNAFTNENKIDEIISKKKNMALWVVSNCDYVNGAKRRMLYVDELMKAGLKVDRYGKCFNNKDEFNKMPKEQMQSYKFYLAFENSYHCKDYMTEKFWYNGLYSNRVPVVLGAKYEEVKRLVPPGSFIHTEEYPSAENLAKYLLYLDKNDTAYREYFNWKIPPYNRNNKMIKLLKLHE